ncbi:hypothetical protein HPULCUR_011828 [Helicostylum pulchrum]|uniref:Uncharacterized protein n=1 Tax=Helicostylum pulchrum TaxID=562976 RepID=A0ABP9YH77_9FUNG
MSSPSSFLPGDLFLKFPELDSSNYEATFYWKPFVFDNHENADTIEHTITQLKELLIHAIVVNQNNSWIFISQPEVYYKDKSFDGTAFTTRHDVYSNDLIVKMDRQTNEVGGSWR